MEISSPEVIGIVAANPLGVIGKDGRTPWHYPADLKHFMETTIGHACVMGHPTYLSISEDKRPLKDRLNMVISHHCLPEEFVPGALVVPDTGSAIGEAKRLGKDLYVCGGGKVYESFVDLIDCWIITEVPVEVAPPYVSLPENFLDSFSLVEDRPLGDALRVKTYRRNRLLANWP